MNLKILSNEERRVTTEILHHLREISSHRLYAVMGYSSLWGYCIKELKYSEASAQRRISAMRLICEIPEIEQKIKAGVLSLSTVSQVQSACRYNARVSTRPKAELTDENRLALKKDLLKAVEGKSKRQTEKILAQVAPQSAMAEKRRVLNAKQTEVRFVMSEELEGKLERIKALTSHRKFNPSYAELFEMMADVVLERIDPERVKARSQVKLKQADLSQTGLAPPPAEVPPRQSVVNSMEQYKVNPKPARYIRVADKRALYLRAGSRCEHVNPSNACASITTTGRRCEETKGLQVDHIIPVACGGSSELENLRLLCFAHNQLAAQAVFGKSKMDSYRKRPQT